MSTREKFQEQVLSRLFWNTAERNDARIADHLYTNREMDSVYTLDEASLFDFFFQFLHELRIFPLMEQITPTDQIRQNIPFLQIFLVYLMKIIGSIDKMDPIHDLLLTDELLMGLCGFNAHQVRNGICKRGLDKCIHSHHEIRGAICVDTLARQIVKINPRVVENFFNKCIQRLAEAKIFPKYIHAACDATDYETTPKFIGCGKVSRNKKVNVRGRRKNTEIKSIKVTIYGWKVWAIYELNTGIPLAIKIDTIEKPDNFHFLAVLNQAKKNVSETSRIRSLVIDRGFLDGKQLFAIDKQSIEFVIPLKSNMIATTDARQLALNADGCFQAKRDVVVTHGYGKKRYTEKIATELIGVPGLMTCDWFNPEGSNANTTRKDYQAIPLNAVVVKTWDNKTPPEDKQVVLATNGGVEDPFVAFDRYDARSNIENNLFRDTKQNWCLQSPPQKNKEGVCVHTYLVMAMRATTKAFLHWQEDQFRNLSKGKETTWETYRRKLKAANRDKLIVFVGSLYGIFFSHEVFLLTGIPVRDAERDLKLSREQVYTKYTGSRPPAPTL